MSIRFKKIIGGCGFGNCIIGMKRFVFLFLGLSFALHADAQHKKAFQYLTFKTDLFRPVNFGIEVPYGERGSVDLNFGTFSSTLPEDISKTDFRIVYKSHFKKSLKTDNYQSTYFSSGFHLAAWTMENFPKQDNSKEYGDLFAGFVSVGIGKRFKILDFWVSSDFMLLPIVNNYRYLDTYGQTMTDKAWKFPVMLFVGCSFDFININKEK